MFEPGTHLLVCSEPATAPTTPKALGPHPVVVGYFCSKEWFRAAKALSKSQLVESLHKVTEMPNGVWVRPFYREEEQMDNEKIVKKIAKYLNDNNTAKVNQAFKDILWKVRYDTYQEALLPEDSWTNLTVAEIIKLASEAEGRIDE
jgi:hypothetical protein